MKLALKDPHSRHQLLLIFWLAVVLSSFILSVTPRSQAQDALPELVRRIKPSAVAIETFDSKAKRSRAAAVFSSTLIELSPIAT